jgi:hypothetical protein
MATSQNDVPLREVFARAGLRLIFEAMIVGILAVWVDSLTAVSLTDAALSLSVLLILEPTRIIRRISAMDHSITAIFGSSDDDSDNSQPEMRVNDPKPGAEDSKRPAPMADGGAVVESQHGTQWSDQFETNEVAEDDLPSIDVVERGYVEVIDGDVCVADGEYTVLEVLQALRRNDMCAKRTREELGNGDLLHWGAVYGAVEYGKAVGLFEDLGMDPNAIV